MINVLIVYSKLYGQYAGNVLRSIRKHSRNVKIYAIVDDLNSIQYPEVDEFTYNEVGVVYPDLSGTRHIKHIHNIAYNYCYLPHMFRDLEKIIVIQVDQIFNRDLKWLWRYPTSGRGIAAPRIVDENTGTMKGCLQNFSEGYHYKGLPEIKTFIDTSMVLDLEKMRKCYAVDIMHEMITKYKMAELTAFNLYAEGDWVEVDERWAISANYKKGFRGKDIWGLHWHGANPWDCEGHYKDYWRRYNK